MANNTNGRATKSKPQRNIVSASHQTPPKYRRKGVGTYLYRVPPKKALPIISQTPLEMSMTSHVGHNSVHSVNSINLNSKQPTIQPQSIIKKTVSADNIVDYVPVSSNHSTYNRAQYQNTQQPKDTKQSKQSKQSIQQSIGTMDTMKQLKYNLKRAETFGQTQLPSKNFQSSNQIHSNQAPQIPANNSIFNNNSDNSENSENSDKSDELYEDDDDESDNNQDINSNIHLASMTKTYLQMKSSEIQINNLKNEINELECLLKQKNEQLTTLEKDRLENSMLHIKPMTLLRRLNAFCGIASCQELDMIQSILSQ